jgi:hypothetical protein
VQQETPSQDVPQEEPSQDAPSVDNPDASASLGGTSLLASMQNAFRSSLVAGTIPNMDASKLDEQFKDMGNTAPDAARESVDMSTVDMSAQQQMQSQMGA